MTELVPFILHPFEPLPGTMSLTISGTLSRVGDVLSVVYRLGGDLDAIALPNLNTAEPPAPSRTDRLWEQTCFEFFVAAGPEKSDQDGYWEFNLSPTGDWNVFALQGYRSGLKEEAAIMELPFTLRVSQDELRLEIAVNLARLLPAEIPWRLGVSAVAVLSDGTETFWAIAHPGPQADFHSAGSFAIQLLP